MSTTHYSFASFIVAFAMGLAIVGCRAPWSTTRDPLPAAPEAPPAATAAAAPGAVPRAVTTASLADGASGNMSAPASPLPQAADAADLAGVFDKVQQVGAIDPGAQRKLMEELQRADPKFWPAMAEQFRASLAYHEELAARPPRTTAKLANWDAEKPMAENRPSTRIGALPDPRHVDSDGVLSNDLARAAPYSQTMQLGVPDADLTAGTAEPPAEFKIANPAYPIAAARAASPPETTVPAATESVYAPAVPTAVEASFETRPAGTAPPAAEASPPSGEASPRDWQALVGEAADDLSRRVAASPATTAEIHQHVSLRMLRLLEGQTESALAPIPHISPADQDYWSRQLFALATYLDHHSLPDDKRRAAASVTHLDEAVSHLRDLGALSLRNLTFCKNIYGYGAVEPYKEDRFSPGEQVALYVEVENYHSESTENGFTTSLGSTYELLDANGQRVDGGQFPAVEDNCRTRRRDFHIQFGLALPEKIAPGSYQFQLVVRDRLSDKIANATATFEVREKGNYSPK